MIQTAAFSENAMRPEIANYLRFCDPRLQIGRSVKHSFFLFIYFIFFFLGMFAIRAERDYVIEEDFMKAARKVSDNKKLESKLDYKPV